MAATIAEFLASVGFQTDEKSLKESLTRVAAFGVAVSAAAGAAFAGMLRVAESEVALAKQAESLNVPIRKLEELQYVAEQTGAEASAMASALGALKARHPHIRDTSALLEQVGARMRGMSEQAAKLYAQKMGIDPSLVPMLRRDVSDLKSEFAAMYDMAGRDAANAAEDSKALLAELGKLKTMSVLLAKAVGGAFLGKLRGSIETLRRTVMENFGKIKRMFETVVELALRVAGVVGAFVNRVVKWASALVAWYDKLDDRQKKLVQGVALFLAAWKLLNAGFLATPLGMVVAGLAGIVALIDDYCTWMEGGESYFDWGPWAETITQAGKALDEIIAVVSILIKGIATGLPLAFQVPMEALKVLGTSLVNLGKLIARLFTGDLSGALEAAGNMFEDWRAGCLAIVEAFCTAASAFFGALWDGVRESFPDFAAWAEKAARAIVDFFSPALDWIKDKLKSLTSWLPESIRARLGLVEKPAAPEQLAAAATAPERQALTPPPLAAAHAAGAQNTRQEVNVEAKTTITVHGAQQPEQVAGLVGNAQNRAAADMARHTRGAVR